MGKRNHYSLFKIGTKKEATIGGRKKENGSHGLTVWTRRGSFRRNGRGHFFGSGSRHWNADDMMRMSRHSPLRFVFFFYRLRWNVVCSGQGIWSLLFFFLFGPVGQLFFVGLCRTRAIWVSFPKWVFFISNEIVRELSPSRPFKSPRHWSTSLRVDVDEIGSLWPQRAVGSFDFDIENDSYSCRVCSAVLSITTTSSYLLTRSFPKWAWFHQQNAKLVPLR